MQYNESVHLRSAEIMVANGLHLQTEQSRYNISIFWPTYVKRWGLSRHEQVCLMRYRFERCFSLHRVDDGRSISRNVSSFNILVHDVINLLYYEYWTDSENSFAYKMLSLWIYFIRILIYRSYLSFCGPSNLLKPAKNVSIFAQLSDWWVRKNVCRNPGG